MNTITVLIQIFLTGRLMKWFGVGITLVLMPLLSAIGFAAIGFAPVLTVLRRSRFCDARQASPYFDQRAKFFSPSYGERTNTKPKSLIDTFGYRFGDQIGCLVLSINALVWLGIDRHFLGGSSAWSNMVRPGYLAGSQTARAGRRKTRTKPAAHSRARSCLTS